MRQPIEPVAIGDLLALIIFLKATPQRGYASAGPPERAIELLPPQRGKFFKEDWMRIVDEKGRRVATA
jgi:arsenate reductase (glutaredoxin)